MVGGTRRAYVCGVGTELPPDRIATTEVEERAQLQKFGFEPGWLERVTGVRERRWAQPKVHPSDLAAAAALRALVDADADPLSVDTVIFAGITRDFMEPAVANVVSEQVGTRRARVFDVSNACNGLIDAVDVADALIRSGKAERALVATGERASISINWYAATLDELMRSVAGLVVGDGGGALLLGISDDPRRGLYDREFRTDSTRWPLAIGGRFRPTTEACPHCHSVVGLRFLCNGREMFNVGFGMMVSTMTAVLERTGWSFADLDVVFCHEASKRFVETGIADLGDDQHPGPKLWSTVERFGNTSTVSLPLAMAEAKAAGQLVAGKKVLLLAGAAGISTAAVAMVW